jgi:hypothetical protein
MSFAAVEFLLGERTDHKGRTVAEYLAFDHMDWETQHDVIQWAFPTKTKSAFNKDAPLVPEDFVCYAGAAELKNTILKLFVSYLRSLSIIVTSADDGEHMLEFQYVQAPLSRQYWLAPHNHNMRRITRVIECLNLFDLGEFTDEFMEFMLYHLVPANHSRFGAQTIVFWVAAWENKLHLVQPK